MLGKFFRGLVHPSDQISDQELIFKVKALLFFTLAFIMNLAVGIIKTPDFVRPALLVAFPIVFASYFIARTKYFKIAGLMSISATFIICFLLIFVLDTESYYRHTALIWIMVTVFMGSLWMSFRSVIILTIFQLIFSIFVAVFGKNMDLSIFASWMPLNVFFCIINLSTSWVLGQYHLVVKNNAKTLELAVHDRTLKLQINVKEREALLKELYHRTKNNMQVIASLLVIQSSFSKDPKLKNVLQEMRSRILSMALVHEKLYKSKDLHAIQIQDYIRSLVDEIHSLYITDKNEITMEQDLENLKFPLEKAVPVGLVLHELLVNAFKYASGGKSEITIKVSCKSNEAGVCSFIVEDNGCGFPEDFNADQGSTMGTLIIKNIIEIQLEGHIQFENAGGAKVSFQVPTSKKEAQ